MPSKAKFSIPKPSTKEVKKWLLLWKTNPNYNDQEKAVDKVFNDYKSNVVMEDILIKCCVLNKLYSTNILNIYAVANHIFKLKIDSRLAKYDPILVADIARIKIKGKVFNFYSFASKYCSHHNEKDYPIYDSKVHKVLMYFKRNDHFAAFKSDDLKNYNKFKTVIDEFMLHYHLTSFNYKEIDQYLWQLGKTYF